MGEMDRRRFLQGLAATTAGLMLGDGALGDEPAGHDRLGELLPQRAFGATGEPWPLLGLGGAHIAQMGSAKEAERTIETAIEGGIRFFDTAEQYGGGLSERRYGRFLTPKYRDAIFLMTKTAARDGDGARQDLEGSLRRLNVEQLDLWQMHAIGSRRDVEQRLEAGVLDVLRKTKEEGKVRYIGFTGHVTPEAHQHMFERFPDADAVQMPINAADPHHASFIENVLPTALERNTGVIAMKTLANGGFFGGDRHYQNEGPGPKLIPDRISVEQALRFAWSLPVSIALTGPDDAAMLQEKIDLLRRFKTMSEADRKQVVADVAGAVEGDSVEFYKTG